MPGYRDLTYPLNVFMHVLTLEEGEVQHLHYALFDSENESIRTAQERSNDLLFSRIPRAPAALLEVGIGLGTTLARLTRAGYDVEGITPDNKQIAIVRERHGDAVRAHCASLEGFVPGRTYDALVFQESSQYIESNRLFERARDLAPRVVVLDEFALRPVDMPGALHQRDAFLDAARLHGFDLVEEIDLSDKAAPTVDYFIARLPKYRDALIADIGVTSEQVDALIESGARYRDLYRNGSYGYRLLSMENRSRTMRAPKRPEPKHGVRFSVSDTESPPQGAFVIRDATASDAPRIMDGFNATFEADRSPEYWLAKFNASPPPASLIAVDEAGKVYAQFSGYRATLNNRGRRDMALFAADVFARRATAAISEGIFLKVFNQFCANHHAAGRFVGMVGFPNPRVLALYQTTGHIAHASEIAEFALENEFSRWRLPFGRLFGKRLRVRSFSDLNPEFLAAVDTIASMRAAWKDVVEFERSAAWIDWRYRAVGRRPRAYCYHLVSVRGQLVGWIVTRQSKSDLVFIDWRLASRGGAATEVLGAACTEVLRQSGASRGVALMSAHLRSEFGETLAWRQSGGVPFAKVEFAPWTLDVSALSLNYGDTDLR
jgi:hypothetical protein